MEETRPEMLSYRQPGTKSLGHEGQLNYLVMGTGAGFGLVAIYLFYHSIARLAQLNYAGVVAAATDVYVWWALASTLAGITAMLRLPLCRPVIVGMTSVCLFNSLFNIAKFLLDWMIFVILKGGSWSQFHWSFLWRQPGQPLVYAIPSAFAFAFFLRQDVAVLLESIHPGSIRVARVPLPLVCLGCWLLNNAVILLQVFAAPILFEMSPGDSFERWHIPLEIIGFGIPAIGIFLMKPWAYWASLFFVAGDRCVTIKPAAFHFLELLSRHPFLTAVRLDDESAWLATTIPATLFLVVYIAWCGTFIIPKQALFEA